MFGRTLILSLASIAGMAASIILSAPVVAQTQDYDVRPQAARLMGDQITKNFSGVTHAGAYNFGRNGNPGNRYTEWHTEEGSIIYREGNIVAKGQWAVARDMMCYKYDSAALGSGCFRIYKLGTCFYFYGSNLIETDDELSRDYWTARSVQKGKRATCEDMIS